MNQLVAQHQTYGYIRDKQSGELLIGANVFSTKRKSGVATSTQGYYQLKCNESDTIRFSYVGYKSQKRYLKANKDTLVNIYLEQGNELNEVTILANKTQNNFNTVRLTPKELNYIPSLSSKPDVMKAMQLMPGIVTMNEGSSAILVRGGDPGQNLYLLDNVPLIYVHHLGGMLSVFNPDMINSVDIYKGAFPAKYGGKLSSVTDITQREGNNSERLSSLSVGFTDLAYSTEGPIKKLGNASYIFTGRKTLTEPLFYLVTSLDGSTDYNMFYGFHDLNGKISWKKNDKNQFYLNLYQGDDYLRYKGRSEGKHLYKNVWGNWMTSTRWNHIFDSGLLSSTTASYNRYRLKDITKFKASEQDKTYVNSYRSIVSNFNLQSDWNHKLSSFWHINFGAQSTCWIFKPNKYANNAYQITDNDKTIQYSNALYMDNNLIIREWATLSIGGRLTALNSKDFFDVNIEPRVQTTIHLPQSQHINISYMGINQNSHLLFTPGDIMQNEIWVPADAQVPVAHSTQYSIGWKGYFNKNKYSLEVDYYKKEMSNLIAYKEGYTFMSGDVNWKTKLENNGSGQSEGIEIMMRKQRGRTTGFASYAYAHTTRQFDKINNGRTYIYEYDRPHTASISIRHEINKKTSINALWVFQTGLPYTPAIGRQYTPSVGGSTTKFYEALIYDERNSERMSDYHRLDLSIAHETLSKRKNRCIWTFSLYNAYARQNPHHYYYNTTNTGEIIQPEYGFTNTKMNMYQICFFPFIPSISYKVFFNKDSKQKRLDYKKTGKESKKKQRNARRLRYEQRMNSPR